MEDYVKKCLILLDIVILLVAFSVYVILSANWDTAPPLWRNQKQSALVTSQGEYVSLQAEAMDDTSLSKAVLSTNETGEWRNETEYSLLWIQPKVYGFDNFGTATYKDGVLYAPSKGDDQVYAVNASNGEIIWNVTVRQCDASPTIDGNIIYVGECCGPYGEPTPFPRALALNRTTGEIVWQFIEPNNYTWVGSPAIYDDYIYYTTFGSGVYALNKTNGSVIWHQDIGRVVCSVAYDNEVIFVSAYDPPGQYAFNATTGELIWRVNFGSSWDSSPVIYNGMVIQVVFNNITENWNTVVLNATTGEFIRMFEGKGSPSTPLVHDGKIFIPSNDWKIWAYNLSTGAELWHTTELHDGTLQDYSYCSPAASGGAIYFQALNGTFYVINETDGTVLWSYRLCSYGFGSPSIGDGCVFITNDGGLYAFKIGPGSGDWPMFCNNLLHRSRSDAIEYVRWPLTQPKDLGGIGNAWVPVKFVWCNKSIESAAIAWRIYLFDNAGNVNATDIKIFYVGMAVHNIAVTNVTCEKTLIEQNETVTINVTVINNGNFAETFELILYYDSVEIDIQTVTLNTGESKVLTFRWNTTGVAFGNYTLKVAATPVQNEVNIKDNVYVLDYPVTVISELTAVMLLITIMISSFVIVTLKLHCKKSKRIKLISVIH